MSIQIQNRLGYIFSLSLLQVASLASGCFPAVVRRHRIVILNVLFLTAFHIVFTKMLSILFSDIFADVCGLMHVSITTTCTSILFLFIRCYVYAAGTDFQIIALRVDRTGFGRLRKRRAYAVGFQSVLHVDQYVLECDEKLRVLSRNN